MVLLIHTEVCVDIGSTARYALEFCGNIIFRWRFDEAQSRAHSGVLCGYFHDSREIFTSKLRWRSVRWSVHLTLNRCAVSLRLLNINIRKLPS